MSFLQVEETGLLDHRPKFVHVDVDNRIVALGSDPFEAVPEAVDQM